ncbi:hypothetical protein SCLCIDRAFT_1224916 [Scleroderma citrinum Foug A]|uniref:Uncharacterized protein n=1 Tax=Scleroderma citrinum Foug A TaxID=1036808 RepID=A0A0C3D4G9_9AGAM|nr:hypothetical protein SCLCIDRAFT_1224916 [Scleroderma citrinum Foug A]
MAGRSPLFPFLVEYNTWAVTRLPESPPTQGDIQRSRDFLYHYEGISNPLYPTLTGSVDPGNPFSMLANDGLDVTVQRQQQSKGSFSPGSPTTPLPTLGDSIFSPLGYPTYPSDPVGGPLAMARTPYPPMFDPSVPMEAYSPPFTTTHGGGGSQTSGLSGPEGSQDFPAHPAQLNSPSGQLLHLANANHLTGEAPSSVYDAATPADSSAPRDRAVSKSCGWKRKDGTRCGAVINYYCQGHLAKAHGITKMSGKRIIWCKWCDQNHQIKRECVLRHVREVHLGFSRLKRGYV